MNIMIVDNTFRKMYNNNNNLDSAPRNKMGGGGK